VRRWLNDRLRACDLEAWYEDLKDFTFPAVFLPLSPEDASTLMAWHVHLKKGDQDAAPPDVKERIAELTARVHEAALSLAAPATGGGGAEEHEAAMGELEEVSAFPPVFVKLSCRSPKDSQGRQVKARQLAKERLLQWREGRPASARPHGNTLSDAVYAGAVNCLRLESAEEVIDTLCTSERVCEDDIPLALSHASRVWTQHIVLRPWADIKTEHEFRVFVTGGRINAVCQYFDACHYPTIAERKEEISSLIQDFFERIKAKVPIRDPSDFVIDLAVDVETGLCRIIEFNPFGEEEDGMGTGTVMFDTRNQADRDILFGRSEGRGENGGSVSNFGDRGADEDAGSFVLRVVEAPVPGVEGRIKGEWRTFLCDEGFLE